MDGVGTPALGGGFGHRFHGLLHILDFGQVFPVEEFLQLIGGGDQVVAAIFPGQRADQVSGAAQLLDAFADTAIVDFEILQAGAQLFARDGILAAGVEGQHGHDRQV